MSLEDNNGGTDQTANDQQGDQSTSNDGTQGTQNPQYITVEQLNRALTNYNKRSESKITELLSPFQQLLNKNSETENNGSSDSVHQAQTEASQPNKDVLKLQRQLEQLTKDLQTSKQEKENATKQAVEERMKAEVLSTLTSLKVEKGDQVYRLIRDNLMTDDNGKLRMKVLDSTLGFEDEKDLKSGLTEWLNSDGSHFLPPRNISGSGATNQSGGTGQRQMDSAEFTRKVQNGEISNKDLAKADLRKIYGDDVLKGFLNTNK